MGTIVNFQRYPNVLFFIRSNFLFAPLSFLKDSKYQIEYDQLPSEWDVIDEGLQFVDKQYHDEFERVLALRRSRVRQLNRTNPDAHCMRAIYHLVCYFAYSSLLHM